MSAVGRRWGGVAVLVAMLLACASWAQAKERIGTTVFARGAVSASVESDIRLIGHGTPIYERDVLTTGEGSFAIVELEDGTEMILRPNTVFRFDEYRTDAGGESMRLNLFQGGMRTVTGEAVRRAPDAFELRTPVATLGVLGTDFSARLCERDCVEEAEELGEDAGGGPDVVGRVAFVKGEARAVSLFGKERALAAGGPVFQGDTLETGAGAFVVIAFRDESRITLLQHTQFRITRHEYDAREPGRASALMRLLRGGIRVVAGLISKIRPEAYEVATPVATISTRGTRFDVVCSGVCAQNGHSSLTPSTLGARALAALLEGLVRTAHAQGAPDGLFVVVRFGRVASESAAGTFEFGSGITAFIGSAQAVPRTDVPLPARGAFASSAGAGARRGGGAAGAAEGQLPAGRGRGPGGGGLRRERDRDVGVGPGRRGGAERGRRGSHRRRRCQPTRGRCAGVRDRGPLQRQPVGGSRRGRHRGAGSAPARGRRRRHVVPDVARMRPAAILPERGNLRRPGARGESRKGRWCGR